MMNNEIDVDKLFGIVASEANLIKARGRALAMQLQLEQEGRKRFESYNVTCMCPYTMLIIFWKALIRNGCKSCFEIMIQLSMLQRFLIVWPWHYCHQCKGD